MVTQLSQGPLLVQAHATNAGQQVVEVILNAPEALNALNGDMVDLLLLHVPLWEADESVIAIIMQALVLKLFVQVEISASSIMKWLKVAKTLAKYFSITNTKWI